MNAAQKFNSFRLVFNDGGVKTLVEILEYIPVDPLAVGIGTNFYRVKKLFTNPIAYPLSAYVKIADYLKVDRGRLLDLHRAAVEEQLRATAKKKRVKK